MHRRCKKKCPDLCPSQRRPSCEWKGMNGHFDFCSGLMSGRVNHNSPRDDWQSNPSLQDGTCFTCEYQVRRLHGTDSLAGKFGLCEWEVHKK